MDLRRADLHTHTLNSDGQLTPTELVRKARQHGLQALAVTDHDTVQGWPEARTAGRKWNVEVIPGVELSVTVGAKEVHLLGYFFDPEHPALRQHLEAFQVRRRERAEGMVARLREAGIPLEFEHVAAQAPRGVLGRPHVALALVEGGHVASYEAAFAHYLKDGGPAFVPKPRFPAADALAMLHEAGGIGVLAHPGHWTGDQTIMALVRAGMDGIETVHPSHDYTLTRYYRQVARDFLLLETGGSDYHGVRPQDEENLGRCSIPYPQLQRIRQTLGVADPA